MSITITPSEGWTVQTDRATITADAEGDVGLSGIYAEWRSWLAHNVETTKTYGRTTFYQCLDVDSQILVRENLKCEEETGNTEKDKYFWRLTATYESKKSPSKEEERDNHRIGDDDEITITTTGGTENVKFALACEDSDGDVVDSAKKLIGWTGGGTEEQEIEGIDIPTPSLEITWKIFLPPWKITQSYLRTLAILTGGVNDSTWQSFAKGEARYEGADLRYTPDADSEEMAVVTLHISCQPNVDGLEITGWDPDNSGQVKTFNVDKRGWSYVSTPTLEDIYDPGGDEILIKLPVAAYVQQVSEYIDFNRLVP